MKRPSKVVLVAGLIAGALAVLNSLVFDFGEPWKAGINVALVAIPAFGIAPIVGAAWRTALELTTAETTAVTGVLTFLQLLNENAGGISEGLHAVITAVIVVAAALGFGPQVTAVVKATRAKAAALHHSALNAFLGWAILGLLTFAALGAVLQLA